VLASWESCGDSRPRCPWLYPGYKTCSTAKIQQRRQIIILFKSSSSLLSSPSSPYSHSVLYFCQGCHRHHISLSSPSIIIIIYRHHHHCYHHHHHHHHTHSVYHNFAKVVIVIIYQSLSSPSIIIIIYRHHHYCYHHHFHHHHYHCAVMLNTLIDSDFGWLGYSTCCLILNLRSIQAGRDSSSSIKCSTCTW